MEHIRLFRARNADTGEWVCGRYILRKHDRMPATHIIDTGIAIYAIDPATLEQKEVIEKAV